MLNKNQIVFLAYFFFIFCSCKGQQDKGVVCREKFKHARDLAYVYPNEASQLALDSALNLANECLKCDSIKMEVVEFKIRLLITMLKFSEGIKFVDSLKENDFPYGYKKNLLSKNLRALAYGSKNDTLQRNLVYAEIVRDLEYYIKQHDVKNKEFDEIYFDLFNVKGIFLNPKTINQEVDDLKKQYPDKEAFFDFFKK